MYCAMVRRLGVVTVIGMDRVPERVALATRMGATHTLNVDRDDVESSVRDITDGRMVDLVVEAVGHTAETINLGIRLIAQKGMVLPFGLPDEGGYPIRFAELFGKDGQLAPSSAGLFDAHDIVTAMGMIADGIIDVSPLITHHMPISEIQAAYELFESRRDGVVKVILDFEG